MQRSSCYLKFVISLFGSMHVPYCTKYTLQFSDALNYLLHLFQPLLYTYGLHCILLNENEGLVGSLDHFPIFVMWNAMGHICIANSVNKFAVSCHSHELLCT